MQFIAPYIKKLFYKYSVKVIKNLLFNYSKYLGQSCFKLLFNINL